MLQRITRVLIAEKCEVGQKISPIANYCDGDPIAEKCDNYRQPDHSADTAQKCDARSTAASQKKAMRSPRIILRGDITKDLIALLCDEVLKDSVS